MTQKQNTNLHGTRRRLSNPIHITYVDIKTKAKMNEADCGEEKRRKEKKNKMRGPVSCVRSIKMPISYLVFFLLSAFLFCSFVL